MIIPGLIGTITALFASFLSNSDSSTQARTVKYSAIVPYLDERPLFGRGLGTFIPELYFFTDNQYMLTLAEMGFLGLLALVFLFLTGIHQGGAIRRLAVGEFRPGAGAGVLRPPRSSPWSSAPPSTHSASRCSPGCSS
ncbi:O-antigen ligase family protein [Streptomyces virginiae]|uniref:O-antigen ligase family protein n=1 Tax=Streptomyces virginiae TaxID=1961 RepID=UPI001FEBB5B2|nr:O-antigen ligase family protein [Streptomyces virginiae]